MTPDLIRYVVASAIVLAGLASMTGVATADSARVGTLIVLNKSEATASLIDCATGTEVTKLPTGEGPHEVAVSPDGRTAVVANYGWRVPGSSLTVIDLPSRSVRSTIDLGAPSRPHGILYFADGKRVVVTAEHRRRLLVVDIEKGEILTEVDTTQDISHMVAITPDASRAFVANIGSGSVSVIDLAAGKLAAVVKTGEGAEGVDVSPDGGEAWVTNRAGDTLTVLDSATLEVLATIPCASFPIRVKFTPDGRRVLVSNARTGDVAVFDAQSRKEIARVAMNAEALEEKDRRLFGSTFGDSPVPVGILVAPDGGIAWVANTNADVVTVIDLKTLEAVDRLVAGKEPDGLAYSPVSVE